MLIHKFSPPKIVSIEAVDGYVYEKGNETSEWSWERRGVTGDGYVVTLDNDTKLEVLVDDTSCCCESWGYVCSEDDTSTFIGAAVYKIETTDTGLNSSMVEAGKGLDGGDIMFVTLYTDKGPLQLAVYNAHNGYYGHPAWVRWAGTEVISAGL